MENTYVNRTFKDSLFRMIFREKEELLSLYNAMNGTAYTDAGELEIRTIEEAIYMGMKNDAAFILEDYLNLYEAQSTWNPNMPLRGLFYFASLYRGYAKQKKLDLYSEKRLKLPAPKYIVFYSGTRKAAERWEEYLSDSFGNWDREASEAAGKMKYPVLECTAQMVNINYGNNKELMRNCRKLYEYSYFVDAVRKQLNEGLELKKAAESAVIHCIENGILEDFLRKHRAEVMDVILAEYDEELHIKSEKQLSFEEGEARGQLEGELRGRIAALLTLLKLRGSVPEDLKKRLEAERDLTVLDRWLTDAAKAQSLEEFLGKM